MLALMATTPGLQLYGRYGFVIKEHTTITLPDGVTLAVASMEMGVRWVVTIQDARSARGATGTG